MSAPSRGTRLLIATGVLLALAGLPLGMTGSVVQAYFAAVAEGRSAAWTAPAGTASEGGALLWFAIGTGVSVVGAMLAIVGFYRLWRGGQLIRPNEYR
ncbi:MAG: hypothetical protein Q8P41_22905 [Pseudomonadota bacterium]|nr:hypothetical protein [Pseudomonadota bacterium]